MKTLILTGMLASGKSIALRMLQDLGYFCTDNIPPALIPSYVSLIGQNPDLSKVALVVDMRAGAYFDDLGEAIATLKRDGNSEVIFFEASDDVLIQRYKAQRRRHLLAGGERIEETIALERKALAKVRAMSDHIIDTSLTTEAQLRQRLAQLFTDEELDFLTLRVNVVSFGFKYGILKDADIVMDVRFLANPFYIPEFKGLDGLNEQVSRYVLDNPLTREFLARFTQMVDFLLPNYKNEGKTQLIIGIGCTGGRHRSVVIAEEFAKTLASSTVVSVSHRDIERDGE